MATRARTITKETSSTTAWTAAWTGLLNGDDGEPVQMPAASDRSVHVVGTFGAGGTLVIEGSNDGGANWAVLNDSQGNALSFTATKIEAIQELVGRIRPRVTAGDGTTNLAVYMVLNPQVI